MGARSAADEARRRAQKQAGYASTIMTSPQGVTDRAPVLNNKLGGG